MPDRVRIIGSYLSPYVRKVLVCLHLKGIPYEIDPIIPFMGNDEFSRLSPIRRIPVLIDDRVTLRERQHVAAAFGHRAARRGAGSWRGAVADRRIVIANQRFDAHAMSSDALRPRGDFDPHR